MQLVPDLCYRALRARDARFDGRFFVGVASTHIYCRPVCTARLPRRENCSFYPSAAAAEGAGFRPCLRCRPELAPGNSSVDASERLAHSAASLIDDGAMSDAGADGIARRLGVSSRHVRRVFENEFGVSPISYAQTARLLLAKRLLTDTTMPVTEVALASGFASLRRFNALFANRYRLNPSALRAARGQAMRLARAPAHTFRLHARPPFAWDALLAFLAARAAPGCELVAGPRYRRTLSARTGDGRTVAGWIEVTRAHTGTGIAVQIDERLLPAIASVLATCKRAFDLDCRPDDVAAVLGPLAADTPGLRVPGAFNGFELAVRAILGQQITVAAARTLAARVVRAFGTPIETPFAELDRVFPTAEALATVAAGDIAALGIIATRARAIVALARAVAEGDIQIDPAADVDKTIAALRALPGIGDWTAHYIALRGLHWPDAFPPGDVALAKALGTKSRADVEQRAAAWSPWRAYAVMHLWKSLEKKR